MNSIKMLAICMLSLSALTVMIFPVPSFSAEKENKITVDWIYGPKKVDIGEIAEIDIPKEYNFANRDDTRKIMELFGNPPTDREQGYLAPTSNKWFLVFEYDEVGYVRDSDKDKLDPDEILESLKKGNEEGNEWRKENNKPELNLIGWYQKPSYDPATNNLEWATVAESEGQKVINYNIRCLGRKGVMEVVLVGGPSEMKSAIVQTKKLLDKYRFKEGNRYAEYVEGDKVAEYGLAALVTGGAVAVAAKSGLLTKFWKFLVIGFAAAGAFVKKMVNKFRGRKDEEAAVAPRGSAEGEDKADIQA